ncbi:MAG: hypothetical protein HY831_04820 [Candidatus Aenigmarchaeota archaeon]|nr:hypothetical protein [Candidatus Aenigmarchaeota archaeon]
MKVDEIKFQFKDEWVLVDVSRVDENGDVIEGTVIAHSKNRDDIYDRLKSTKDDAHVAIFYTGKMPKIAYLPSMWIEK